MTKNKQGIYGVIILLFMVVLFISSYQNIDRLGDKLVSYDPWYHKRITDYTLESGDITYYTPDAVLPTRINYFTLLYPLSAILSDFTGLTTFTIFQVMGPFLLVLINLGIYISIKRMTGKIIPSLLGAVLFSSGYYTLTRTAMNLPENYDLFFLTLAIFIIVSKLDITLIIFPFLGNIYYHYRSVALLLFMIFLYGIISLKIGSHLRTLDNFKRYIVPCIIIVMLSLPIISEILKSYIFIITQHVGTNPEWKTIEPNPAIYNTFGFEDYIYYFGEPFLLFAFLGFVLLLKENKYRATTLTIMTMFVATVFLTQSTRIGLYIQPYRFAIYLGMFGSIIGAIAIHRIMKNSKHVGIITMAILIIMMMYIVVQPHGWSGMTDQDFDAIDYIKTCCKDSIVITAGSSYSVMNMPNSEWDIVAVANIFKVSPRNTVQNFLHDRYGKNRSIILAISYTGKKLLNQNNPDFFTIFNDSKVYEKDGVILYRIYT